MATLNKLQKDFFFSSNSLLYAPKQHIKNVKKNAGENGYMYFGDFVIPHSHKSKMAAQLCFPQL